MILYLVMKEDADEYDSEEVVTSFFNKEEGMGYINDKLTEQHEISISDDYARYKNLSQVAEDRDLSKKEKYEIGLLDIQFKDFRENNWWLNDMEVEDSKKFFREKKLNYLFDDTKDVG